MGIRLNKVLTELDINLQTAVDYLKAHKEFGEIRDDATTLTKISDDQYEALVDMFSKEKSELENAPMTYAPSPSRKQIVLGKIDVSKFHLGTHPKPQQHDAKTINPPSSTKNSATDSYDVFISYSRGDFVKDDVVIPGNPISAILDCFDKNGIRYWVDREGIFSGQEFIEVITHAIANSKMLVFVSSEQSNQSMYTAGEIFEAIDEKKLIIPVRIDNTPYNSKFKLLIRPLDYIDYCQQPNSALSSLVRAVNKEKERIRKIELEEKEYELRRERELMKERIVKEIPEKIKDFQSLSGQQDFVLRELYAMSKSIGIKSKRCPICDTEMPIDAPYCTRCAWHFAPLYGIYGLDLTPVHDENQLDIARQLWQKIRPHE